jgi:hypothetical protein
MQNVNITGGTSAQTTAIMQGHSDALAAAIAARSAAAAGGTAVMTWFGTTPASTIAGNFQSVVNIMTNWTFNYDLESQSAQIMDGVIYENIYVVFPPPASGTPTTVTATLSTWFWDYSAVSITRARTRLALSVLHEALSVFSGSTINELTGTQTSEKARSLAVGSPTTAAVSTMNYLFFAEQYIPTSTASSPAEPQIVTLKPPAFERRQ